jgi:DNA-binding PadR family transcriptional regulator
MSSRLQDPAEHLPLATSAFHILLALANGDRHGYAITKEVAASTKGHVPLGSGTLYRQIKQLVIDGWIAEIERDDVVGRRYYRLTTWGRRIAQAEATRLAELVEIARSRDLVLAPVR